MSKQYENRNAMDLDVSGGFYCRHVSAMTAEGLDTKSAIAAELGHRDRVIHKQAQRIKELEKAVSRVLSLAEVTHPDSVAELETIAAECGSVAEVRPEFSVGFGNDGATILKDGVEMTFYETLAELQKD